jgi:hypothetical protein
VQSSGVQAACYYNTVEALLTHKISALLTHTPKTLIPQQLIGLSNPELCCVISWPVVSVPQNPHAHKFKCETRRPLPRVMGYESANPNFPYGLRGLRLYILPPYLVGSDSELSYACPRLE